MSICILLQKVLPNYQIVVVSADHGYQIIFKGPEKPEEKLLILIKVADHYHACNSLTGFFNRTYYCLKCEKGFKTNNLKEHKCTGKKCFACHQSDCPDFHANTDGDKAHVPCSICERKFFGSFCQMNHLTMTSQDGIKANPKEKNSVCCTHKKCNSCGKTYSHEEVKHGHICGYARCPSCEHYNNLHQHQCHQQVLEEDDKRKKQRKRKRRHGDVDDEDDTPPQPPLFVYFDIEARQDDGKHVANLLCAETSESDDSVVFERESCIGEFLDWLREDLVEEDEEGRERPIIVVVHNFQGYDSYFILDELYKQYIVPSQIVNGAKILALGLPDNNVKFVDSLSFLPMPLSAFPKSFGIIEQKKGFFPHFFNTVDNQDYVGHIPAKDYYDPEGMSKSRKAEFDRWYQQKLDEDYVFNLKEELLAYCKSDVKLLKQGCQSFQQEFKNLADFDPLEKCITIASACNRYYRKKCIQPNTIASEPIRGWHGKAKPHSHASLEWLHCQNFQLPSSSSQGDLIQHAGNCGERLIQVGRSQTHVDGFDPNTNTVYEFDGCFYHGCPVCFPNRDQRHPKHDDMTMRDIYDNTISREQAIRNAGYNLIVMWECQWKKLKKDNAHIQEYVENLQLVPRLEPREAFFGGRTNAVKLYHKTNEGEQIHYVDFTSLYPWVNKNCEYPVGHPVIITQPDNIDIDEVRKSPHNTPSQLHYNDCLNQI